MRMRVIVSSKTLSDTLKKCDLEKRPIQRVEISKNKLTLCWEGVEIRAGMVKASVAVEASCEGTFAQSCCAWNLLKRDMEKWEDRPIVLELFDNAMQLLLQY